MRITDRTFRILTGIIALTFAVASVYFGVKVRAGGALRPVYQLSASFDAAGQGLQSHSDVKVHGFNIGRVRHVKLVRGRALVRMDIDESQRVPVSAKATIRPKTLFGEKFIDIDPGDVNAEVRGPFLHDEGVIRDTVGGFELERILTELYPILKAIHPEDLSVVLDTLAQGGQGEGPAINRQIANFQKLADVQVRHDADTREFLDDLSALSDELAARAGDVVGAARDLNVALPPLNQRGDELGTVLDQTARLSSDVADILNANQDFQVKAITEGGQALQILADRLGQIGPLVTGLRQYFQVQAEAGHVPFGDGTFLAAVKFIVGGDCPNGRVGCGANQGTTSAPAAAAASRPGPLPAGVGVVPTVPVPVPVPTSGVKGLTDLLVGGLP